MKNVVIAGYARSPFTLAHKGALQHVRPDDIAAQVVAALVERSKLDLTLHRNAADADAPKASAGQSRAR